MNEEESRTQSNETETQIKRKEIIFPFIFFPYRTRESERD